MHELSIADAVVQIACAHAAGRRVTRVDLRVGHLRQVVPSALEFAFGLVAEGTVAQGAELTMEEVPAVGRCRDCAAETVQHEFPLQCAVCGGFGLDVVRGEELLVDALEVEEEASMTKGR
jgi:hydrogenase nickel incorporation protein HypA/HybF